MNASPSPPPADQVEAAQVLDRLEQIIDTQTYDELKTYGFDPPDDAEFALIVTAKERREILAALSCRRGVAALRPVTSATSNGPDQTASSGGPLVGGNGEVGVDTALPAVGVAPEGMRELETLADELDQMAATRQEWADHPEIGGKKPRMESYLRGKRYGYSHAAQLIRSRLAALPPASGSDHGPVGWRPIADAPRDGTRILLSGPYDKHPGYWMHAAIWAVDKDGDDNDGEPWANWGVYVGIPENWSPAPTHWQPLPPPPVGDK